MILVQDTDSPTKCAREEGKYYNLQQRLEREGLLRSNLPLKGFNSAFSIIVWPPLKNDTFLDPPLRLDWSLIRAYSTSIFVLHSVFFNFVGKIYERFHHQSGDGRVQRSRSRHYVNCDELPHIRTSWLKGHAKK